MDDIDILRIGEIRYANCTPLYATLKKLSDCRDYAFIPGEPASLNALLASGGIDVSSSSSVEYARHWYDYLVIPEVSISSRGSVGSILLFSKKPIESLGGEKIAVSSASATSVVLLKVLLRFHYGIGADLVPRAPVLKTMLDGTAAALLIGDEALKERIAVGDAPGLLVYDLGKIWQEFSGLPFVYALWMVRADSASRAPSLAAKFKEEIIKAKEISTADYGEISLASPESAWMGRENLIAYWRAMSYDLGDAHIGGLSKFFELAGKVGEVPHIPALRFL
ncbi:MAG: menaquinone biosynthesis protein [Nitrospirota bacterium]